MPKREKVKNFEFQVIAGALKGRRIKAPDFGITRPPLSRLRKSIFDFLNPYLENAVYLDLFSGTGSYLFEAVSRGVKLAYGVELESRLVESINKQAAKYEIDNKLICLCDDVLKIIPKFQKQSKLFDIVMIAPPQYKSIIDQTLKVMSEHKIIKDESLILCQHDSSEKNIDFQNFKIAQQRKYGNTTFTVLNSYEK